MYVSSYSTYISTNASQKSDRSKYEKDTVSSKPFNLPSLQKTSSDTFKTSSLPIDYISTPLLLKNKYEIESQKQKMQNKEDRTLDLTKKSLAKFQEKNFMLNIKDTYENNSVMFSIFQKPSTTLDQTPKINQNLPKKAQEVQESSLRNIMVNTYIANDTYYKITA